MVIAVAVGLGTADRAAKSGTVTAHGILLWAEATSSGGWGRSEAPQVLVLVHRCIKGICGEEGGSPTTRLEERNVHYHMTIEHQILHDVHTVVIVMKLEVLNLCQLLCKGFSCWRLILDEFVPCGPGGWVAIGDHDPGSGSRQLSGKVGSSAWANHGGCWSKGSQQILGCGTNRRWFVLGYSSRYSLIFPRFLDISTCHFNMSFLESWMPWGNIESIECWMRHRRHWIPWSAIWRFNAWVARGARGNGSRGFERRASSMVMVKHDGYIWFYIS